MGDRSKEAVKYADLVDTHARELAEAHLDCARAKRRIESAEARFAEALGKLIDLASAPSSSAAKETP